MVNNFDNGPFIKQKAELLVQASQMCGLYIIFWFWTIGQTKKQFDTITFGTCDEHFPMFPDIL